MNKLQIVQICLHPTGLVALCLTFLIITGCSSSNYSTKESLSKSETEALIYHRQTESIAIKPGDRIDISVWGYEEFNVRDSVSTRGFIQIPMVGEVEAAGKTKEQFKNHIRTELGRYIKGDIFLAVTIKGSQDNKVTILGSVATPSNVYITNQISLVELISRSGGTTDAANLEKIKVFKNGKGDKAIEVDLKKHLKDKKDLASLELIHPGDVVYIPPKKNVFGNISTFIVNIGVLAGIAAVFTR